MKTRLTIAKTFLWLFVLLAGIVSGGSIFEHLTIMPIWFGSPPESVISFHYPGIQVHFFGKFSPAFGLASLGLIIVSWMLPHQQRKWALAAGVCGVAVILLTFFFFLPIARQLLDVKAHGLSGDEVVRLVGVWHTWQWGRWALLIGGWVLGLRALSLSHKE
jgi:hypothetical protein